MSHSAIHDNEQIPEYEDIAIGAISFDLEDIKEMYLYSWLIQSFHSFGIFEYITIFYNQVYGLTFMKIYEEFLEYCRKTKSLFSEEYEIVVNYISKGYSGKGWNHQDDRLGDIFWPIEEASWLRLTMNRSRLKKETLSFLNYLEKNLKLNTKLEKLEDLTKFQTFLLTCEDDKREIKSENFEFNWKEYFMNSKELKNIQINYFYESILQEKNIVDWAYKTMWYGRSSKKYKFHPENLKENANIVKLKQISVKPNS